MGPVWEYQWEYTDLDDGKVKTLPYWLTDAEAGYSTTLLQNDARRLTHTRRERVGPPEWRAMVAAKPSGIKPLPEFDSLQEDELRELWRRVPDPDAHRAILEIVHARRVMGEIEKLVAVIRAEYGDKLVAIYKLRSLVKDERRCTGEIGGKPDAEVE
ncbi:hypothetical protein ACV229_26685 [Burkholderia sp. MR1-5-21]